MPLDKRSVIWGLLLSIAATGLYDTIKAIMKGDYQEETIVVVATVAVVSILIVMFRKEFFKKE